MASILDTLRKKNGKTSAKRISDAIGEGGNSEFFILHLLNTDDSTIYFKETAQELKDAIADGKVLEIYMPVASEMGIPSRFVPFTTNKSREENGVATLQYVFSTMAVYELGTAHVLVNDIIAVEENETGGLIGTETVAMYSLTLRG